MSQVFNTDSPERGWAPFMDWMIKQGLDPVLTREVAITGDRGVAEVYDLDSEGRRFLIPGSNDVSVSQVQFDVKSDPPLRIPR